MRRRRKTIKFELIKKSSDFVNRNKRGVLILFVLCALVILAIFMLCDFFRSASYFDCYAIEIIKLSEKEGFEPKKGFFKLTPKINIFIADPITLSNKIKEAHPEFQNVLITKYLPNRLIATIIDRKAVAKIKVGRIYQIDYEGVVMPTTSKEEPASLPLIIGLESQLFNPSMGKKVESPRLSKALTLLALLTKEKRIKYSAIGIIDVSYPKNTTIKMDEVNVIFGEGEFERKVELLSKILNDPKIHRQNIDYIDLRFTDVVISTKRAKK